MLCCTTQLVHACLIVRCGTKANAGFVWLLKQDDSPTRAARARAHRAGLGGLLLDLGVHLRVLDVHGLQTRGGDSNTIRAPLCVTTNATSRG